MAKNITILRRTGYALAVFLLLASVSYPAFQTGHASAAQLSTRSITISDSGASGGTITSGVGSGLNVTYRVQFTTTNAAQSLVIDFCDGDPIIGDTCVAPTGMDASTAVLSTVSGETDITAAGWTATVSTSRIKLAKGSGSSAAAGIHTFELTGIKNPTSVKSYYGRIYTYANTSWGTYSAADTDPSALPTPTTGPGNFLDYGGIALSTNNIITITARVQEQLTFCVSGADPATWATPAPDCSSSEATAAAPALTLGHGTPTATLTSDKIDHGEVYTQLSTNATHGAVVAMRNSNTSCGGLSADGGTTCDIPAIPTGNAGTAGVMTIGTAAFGLFVSDSTLSTGGSGAVVPESAYHDPAHVTIGPGNTASDVYYGMDITTTNPSNAAYPQQYSNVKGLYGSIIALTATPCYRVDNTLSFGATAGLTTPAGIYTANMDLIATGTF